MSLNENITKFRSLAGETQGQLAEVLGVSNRTVSKWECGEGEPDVATLMKIAGHYGITLDELCGYAAKNVGYYDGLSAGDAIVQMYSDAIRCVRNLQKRLEERDEEAYGEVTASDSLVPPVLLEHLGDFTAHATGVYTSGIWSHVINSPENNFAVTILRNGQNFRWMGERADELAKIFAYLADPDTLKLLRTLLTSSFPRGFTADYAAEKAGITAEKAADFLDFAEAYADNVELIDGKARVYDHIDAIPLGAWTALLCIAYELLDSHTDFDGYYKAMYRPIRTGEASDTEKADGTGNGQEG